MTAPILFLSTRDGTVSQPGRPQIVRDTFTGAVASIALSGGASATFNAGESPVSLPPGASWALTAGTGSGFNAGRVMANIVGNGTGATGYFVLNGSGVVTSLVVTNGGSGYTGSVTATPRYAIGQVWFDLGDDWHQYTMANLTVMNLGSDALLRATVQLGRVAGRAEAAALMQGGSTWAEAYIQPMGGGWPARLVRIGGRFVMVELFSGSTVPPEAFATLVASTC